MRVISGRWKGQHLVTFQASHIRPTTDRVKESVFNIIQADVPEAYILDLFSGTGNLGIEALSRGAQYVRAVEKNKKSVHIIQKNCEKLGISKQQLDLGPFPYTQDVRSFLKKPSVALEQMPGRSFDLILIDPPFTEAMGDEVMQLLSAALQSHPQLLSPEGRVVLEASRHENIKPNYSPLVRSDQRDFGDKSVHFFCHEK